jgi:membrane protease subunit HflC
MKNKYKNILIALAFILITLLTSLFTVKETQTAFVVEFGKIIRTVDKAGLNIKVPLLQEVVYFDKRIIQVDSPAREIIALDQKRLIVDAYLKYRITKPSIFFTTLKDQSSADSKITSILDSSMRQVVASYPLAALLSAQRADIMNKIRDIITKQTISFGVDIVDVRIIRADLPAENSESIFLRMRTEREKEAQELRAKGVEESTVIKSQVDRDGRIIKGKAQMEADIIMGSADAKASKIYAQAFSQDPDFFAFYRSMESYQKSINPDNTQLYLTSKHDYLKEMKDK